MNFFPDDDSVFYPTEEKCPWSLDLMVYGIGKAFSSLDTVSTDGLDKILEERRLGQQHTPTLVVDIRERPEYDVSHIEGAKWVDFSKPLKQQSDDLISLIEHEITQQKENGIKKLQVVGYCAMGLRASWLLSFTKKRLEKRKKRAESPYGQGGPFESAGTLTNAHVEFFNVEGSIFKWAHEDRPMVNEHGVPTTIVHGNSLLLGRCTVDKKYLYPGPYQSWL